MKKQLSIREIMLVVALIALGVLGAYIGLLTYQYKILARGILSLLVLYLVFQFAWHERSEKIDALFIFPKSIKYYVFGFFWAWIVILAIGFVIEMVLFLVD